jgi:probable HAF family extracellular repeat protein
VQEHLRGCRLPGDERRDRDQINGVNAAADRMASRQAIMRTCCGVLSKSLYNLRTAARYARWGTLSGDFAAIATGINDQGQVVGNTSDANFVFSRAFIWQRGVMTHLNTLFPASSNL